MWHLLKSFALLLCLCLVVAPAAYGSTLEERRNEWAFSFTSLDQQDVGETSDLSFHWSYILQRGYFEIGLAAEAFTIDFDDNTLDEIAGGDGSAIGPAFTWNWTPTAERATGFLFASAQAIGGDLGDQFDSLLTSGFGIKAFLGNCSAIHAFVAFDHFDGASGFEDLDQTRLGVGLALYTNSR